MSYYDDPRFVVTPDCCEPMRALKAIVLSQPRLPPEPGEGRIGLSDFRIEVKPIWIVRVHFDWNLLGGDGGRNLDRAYDHMHDPATCCPYCGKPVPDLQLKPKSKWPKKILSIKDPDDDYCGTCGKDMGCRCVPPWMCWEIAR